jgi:hypothetical protein
VKSKSNPPVAEAYSSSHWHLGLKAFYLEPLLILGASLLWVAVLPLAAIVWSGTALTKMSRRLRPSFVRHFHPQLDVVRS